jgi:hypothetical protein
MQYINYLIIFPTACQDPSGVHRPGRVQPLRPRDQLLVRTRSPRVGFGWIEALVTTEPTGPIERTMAALLVQAHRRRLRAIVANRQPG